MANQLALDAKTNDLVKAFNPQVEIIKDVEFNLPVINLPTSTEDAWADVYTGTYTSNGQAFLDLGQQLTGLVSNTMYIGSEIIITIDVASGVSATNQLKIVADKSYYIGDVGVTQIVATVDSEQTIVTLFPQVLGLVVLNSMSIKLTTGNGLERVSDGRYIVQLVQSRLRTVLNEWLLDPNIGWLNNKDFEKHYDLFNIELRARSIITSTPNVKEILNMDLQVTNRVLYLTFTAKTTFGTVDLTVPWSL